MCTRLAMCMDTLNQALNTTVMSVFLYKQSNKVVLSTHLSVSDDIIIGFPTEYQKEYISDISVVSTVLLTAYFAFNLNR